ncbi:MAG: RNA-binding S4 domain-containing protein [Marinisporobacter sp.]|jgi:ribosomal 50S subunit-recycling heat shock protein|nr:RNA-binding S4 domain-containing protein [Marinisporobacter sp.]
MRLDKFLKNSRLIKRRTVAKDACDQGRVSINEKTAKASSEVEVGDTITILFGSRMTKVEIMALADHVTKDFAKEMYRIIE